MKDCDCLNMCGDDPDIRTGEAQECKELRDMRAAQIPKGAIVTDSKTGQPGAYTITFRQPLTPPQITTLKERIGACP